MFVVVQHPFADLRFLIGSASGRLARPSWPLVEPHADFIRSFGQVDIRKRGGVPEWSGEEVFCRANSALRLPDRLRERTLGSPALPATIEQVFRRFHSDGMVARLETGLQLSLPGHEVPEASPRDIKLLLQHCAELPARVRGPTGAWKTLPIIESAPVLAQHYLRATTEKRLAGKTHAWWFSSGSPVVLVEWVGINSPPLPANAHYVLESGGVSAHHWWRTQGKARHSVWFLVSAEPRGEVLRRLRIHLLRLHAERECLRQVIMRILRGTFDYASSEECSESTQQYLNDAIRLLEKTEREGFPQSALLDACRQAMGTAAGDNATLQQMRRQIGNKVKRYVDKSGNGGPMNTTIQIGNVSVQGDFNVVTAKNIRESFNKASSPGVKAELKERLEALTIAASKMIAKLPAEEAEKASQDLQTLATEATSKSPRKAWYELSSQGLIDAAKTVAEMAAPITAAVTAVTQILAP